MEDAVPGESDAYLDIALDEEKKLLEKYKKILGLQETWPRTKPELLSLQEVKLRHLVPGVCSINLNRAKPTGDSGQYLEITQFKVAGSWFMTTFFCC